MTCSEFRDRVDELIDDLLPPEEAGRFHGHCEDCAECGGRRDEARAFAELLESKGGDALGAWEAARLTLRAAAATPTRASAVPARPILHVPPSTATAEPSSATMFARRVPRGVWRLIAAAVLVAAVGLVRSAMLGDDGPVVLAAGEPASLDFGAEATSQTGWRLVSESQGAQLTLRKGSDGRCVDFERGVVQFRVDPGFDLTVTTPHGSLDGHSAVFIVDVRGDGGVAVSVVSGRVECAGVEPLYQGERLEIAASGRVQRISSSQLEQIELDRELRNSELVDLRRQNARLQEQLIASVDSAARNGVAAATPTELDLDALGEALFVMLDPELPRTALEKQDAKEFVYANARLIRERYDVVEATTAIADPRVFADVAPGFLRALAPQADAAQIDATVVQVRDAMRSVVAAMDSDPTPTELAAARQRALVAVMRGIETRLGSEKAGEIVHALPREWRQLRPMQMRLDKGTESSFVKFYKKQYDLSAAQESQLRVLVQTYVADTLVAQQQAAALLPPTEVASVLFPFDNRRGRSIGSRDTVRTDADERSEPQLPAIGPSERVAAKFREIEARLAIAGPRMRFERSVWTILRSDQRARGHSFSTVITFLPPSEGE